MGLMGVVCRDECTVTWSVTVCECVCEYTSVYVSLCVNVCSSTGVRVICRSVHECVLVFLCECVYP